MKVVDMPGFFGDTDGTLDAIRDATPAERRAAVRNIHRRVRATKTMTEAEGLEALEALGLA